MTGLDCGDHSWICNAPPVFGHCHLPTITVTNKVTSVTEVRSASTRLPVCGAPLVGVITTIYYVATITFHRQVCYRALSLRYACIRSSGIILILRLPVYQISFLSRPPLLN